MNYETDKQYAMTTGEEISANESKFKDSTNEERTLSMKRERRLIIIEGHYMGSITNKVCESFLWPLKCFSTVRVGICVWCMVWNSTRFCGGYFCLPTYKINYQHTCIHAIYNYMEIHMTFI